MGCAVAVHVARHTHPHARPEMPAAPSVPSGIDYLGLVEKRRDRASDDRISYAGIGPDAEHGVPNGPPVDSNQLVPPGTSKHSNADHDDHDDSDDHDHSDDHEEGIR